jgi:hypothetical protein
MALSSEEKEAERLYYALVSWSLCKRAFVIYSKDLEARSPIAGAYLKFLILRGQQWPTVGQGAEVQTNDGPMMAQ